jgi:hypothetical protein
LEASVPGRAVVDLNGAYADRSHWRRVIADLGSDDRHVCPVTDRPTEGSTANSRIPNRRCTTPQRRGGAPGVRPISAAAGSPT